MNPFDHIGPADFAKNSAIILDGYGAEIKVTPRKGYANGSKVWRFLAPGWRPMRFSCPVAAARKLATHPRLIRWEA